jgi:predicted NAD/FAD-dependent oxidoreductase
METREKTAIIGAGMAGLTVAKQLAAAGAAVTVFDKGMKPGGRVATRRGDFTFNHGCQFATARDDGLRETLERAGAQIWPAAGAHKFIGVPDMAALAEGLAAGLDVRLGVQVTGLRRGSAGWTVSLADGTAADFATVVCAIPAPQAAVLLAEHEFAARLLAVHLAPCWALMLGFDAAVAGPDVWRGDGKVAWIAREGSRPGYRGTGMAYTVHASADWSTAHLEERPEEVAAALLDAFAAATGITAAPVFSRAHRWRYALADRVLGQASLWDANARLGVCGDWCLDGRLEAAYLSGKDMAGRIVHDG